VSAAAHQIRHLHRICRVSLSQDDRSIKISHCPGFGSLILYVAWNEVKVQMASSFTEGNDIHPITASEMLNESTSLLD